MYFPEFPPLILAFVKSGHYIEKAEIPISAVQVTLDEASSSFSSSFSPQHQQRHGDVYKSCLNFEVKVMECASGRGNMSAGENVLIDRCLLCVGVMQLAHKVSSTNDSNHSNGSGGVNCAPEDGSVLDPEELASGKYEVLLYTVYNPDAEIDVTLVGRVTVRLHIPECSLPVVVPIVPNGRASSSGFDLQRFVVHEKSTGASYLYWAQCLFSCCEALQRLVEEPENTVRERKAATAAAEIQKETLYSELKLLLQVLGRPEYTDCAVHAEIVKYLLSCGSNALRKLVLPALHAYFQASLYNAG